MIKRKYPPRTYARRSRMLAQRSKMVGELLRERLYAAKVSVLQFCRLTGLSHRTGHSYVSGAMDGKIPLWVDLVVEFIERCPDIAVRRHYRIRGMRGGQRRPSIDSGAQRARSVAWSERRLDEAVAAVESRARHGISYRNPPPDEVPEPTDQGAT